MGQIYSHQLRKALVAARRNFSQIIEEVEDYPLSSKEGERIRQSFKEERDVPRAAFEGYGRVREMGLMG